METFVRWCCHDNNVRLLTLTNTEMCLLSNSIKYGAVTLSLLLKYLVKNGNTKIKSFTSPAVK